MFNGDERSAAATRSPYPAAAERGVSGPPPPIGIGGGLGQGVGAWLAPRGRLVAVLLPGMPLGEAVPRPSLAGDYACLAGVRSRGVTEVGRSRSLALGTSPPTAGGPVAAFGTDQAAVIAACDARRARLADTRRCSARRSPSVVPAHIPYSAIRGLAEDHAWQDSITGHRRHTDLAEAICRRDVMVLPEGLAGKNNSGSAFRQAAARVQAPISSPDAFSRGRFRGPASGWWPTGAGGGLGDVLRTIMRSFQRAARTRGRSRSLLGSRAADRTRTPRGGVRQGHSVPVIRHPTAESARPARMRRGRPRGRGSRAGPRPSARS